MTPRSAICGIPRAHQGLSGAGVATVCTHIRPTIRYALLLAVFLCIPRTSRGQDPQTWVIPPGEARAIIGPDGKSILIVPRNSPVPTDIIISGSVNGTAPDIGGAARCYILAEGKAAVFVNQATYGIPGLDGRGYSPRNPHFRGPPGLASPPGQYADLAHFQDLFGFKRGASYSQGAHLLSFLATYDGSVRPFYIEPSLARGIPLGNDPTWIWEKNGLIRWCGVLTQRGAGARVITTNVLPLRSHDPAPGIRIMLDEGRPAPPIARPAPPIAKPAPPIVGTPRPLPVPSSAMLTRNFDTRLGIAVGLHQVYGEMQRKSMDAFDEEGRHAGKTRAPNGELIAIPSASFTRSDGVHVPGLISGRYAEDKRAWTEEQYNQYWRDYDTMKETWQTAYDLKEFYGEIASFSRLAPDKAVREYRWRYNHNKTLPIPKSYKGPEWLQRFK